MIMLNQPMPEKNAAAYGDLLAGVLALVALIALKSGWAGVLALVWGFNIVGSVVLLNALRHWGLSPDFGTTWYIPTFIVPVLLVTHFINFVRLVRRKP